MAVAVRIFFPLLRRSLTHFASSCARIITNRTRNSKWE
nr:MAG TPA: hypothetical protein [Caudoviricetes sp.]